MREDLAACERERGEYDYFMVHNMTSRLFNTSMYGLQSWETVYQIRDFRTVLQPVHLWFGQSLRWSTSLAEHTNRFYSRVVLVKNTAAQGFVCEGAPAFMHEFWRGPPCDFHAIGSQNVTKIKLPCVLVDEDVMRVLNVERQRERLLEIN